MNPYQHGEVYVTVDGAETDLDLGHYERYIDENLTASNNLTTGKIYSGGDPKENGAAIIWEIPSESSPYHRSDQGMVKKVASKSQADVSIVEVGGTVGDIEGSPSLEAIRQIKNDVGAGRVLSLHVTLLPHLGAAGELKTKPTQHSVKELRAIGIQPDILVCRTERCHPPIIFARSLSTPM